MMVINWIGNNGNCFVVHMISTLLPLRDLNVVECLSQRLRGSPFYFVSNPSQNNFTDLFGTKGQLDHFRFFLKDMATAQKILFRGLAVTKLLVETRSSM